jgi:hypothetical protein
MKLTFNKTYALFFLIILILEIGIATYFNSGFVRYTLGDYLVVILIYCFFKSFLKVNSIALAIAVLCFAYAIEFGQYYNILETFGLHHNYWAVIILGSHFSVSDLLAYTLGMSTFLIIDITRLNYE